MRHRLFIPAATALLIALTACTQDELSSPTGGVEGAPVIIRATGLSVEATPQAAPSTRATVDGDWQGVQTVALKMGDAVKEYTVTATDADGYKSATLSRESDPHYWTSREAPAGGAPAHRAQPRPDYRIGMVAPRRYRHHTDACREGGRRPEQVGRLPEQRLYLC